jgi:hypothetical protein
MLLYDVTHQNALTFRRSQVSPVPLPCTSAVGSWQEKDISIFGASQLSSDALSCTIELKGRDDWDHRNQGLSSIGNTKHSAVRVNVGGRPHL